MRMMSSLAVSLSGGTFGHVDLVGPDLDPSSYAPAK
jgi:hypothetical protein